MARSLDDIYAELNKRTDTSKQNILGALAELPTAQKAEEAGLQAKLGQANEEILGGARRRGLGFSGIPLAEQAKYAATEFAPALARNASQFSQRKASLQDALNGIDQQNYLQANDIYNQERNFAEQQRQFDLNYALQQQQARAAGSGGGFNLGGGQQAAAQQAMPKASRKADGGFAFTDPTGNPISAATFAQQSGRDIRDVLYEMGQSGDTYAQQVYNQLATDPILKTGDQNYMNQIKKLYSPLFWGA